jgi:hypothetical protein
MDRSLRIFGPASAALHIFAQIALIFELGLVGTWVKSYWLPLTRRLWSEVFAYLAFLDFNPTDAEKDALTAAAFFTPLAVAAGVLWLKDRGKDDGETEYGSPITASLMRVAAFIASIAILFFVSQQIIADALSIYSQSTKELQSVELFSMLSIVGLGGIIVTLVLFYRLDAEIRRSLLIFGATFGALLEFVIIGAPVIFAAYFAVTELGMIRSAALLMVTFCIVLAISVRPAKVLQVAYVVMGLLLASWLVGFLQRFGDTITTTPPS